MPRKRQMIWTDIFQWLWQKSYSPNLEVYLFYLCTFDREQHGWLIERSVIRFPGSSNLYVSLSILGQNTERRAAPDALECEYVNVWLKVLRHSKQRVV